MTTSVHEYLVAQYRDTLNKTGIHLYVMYVRVCVCIPTHIHRYIHTYVQTDRQTDRQTDMCTYIHLYMYTHTICVCNYVYIHIYIHKSEYTCIHKCGRGMALRLLAALRPGATMRSHASSKQT